MSISAYIKEIGRGRDGARALTREQAADLMGQVLDQNVSDLEIGAFCLAMRIKGETAAEMAGFLDAAHARLNSIQIAPHTACVVLPSYNGARKLPVLTPLLAHLLARQGVAVVMHGTPTENSRVSSLSVLQAMKDAAFTMAKAPAHAVCSGEVVFAPTEVLCPGLKALLDVRRVVGLRNSAHSLVKLMNPSTSAQALLLSSYTHPEYAVSMAETLALTHTRALLLRGTEGEAVADARRQPQMDAFVAGTRTTLLEAQSGSLTQLPDLPALDAQATAQYIQAVLAGNLPTPAPIAAQVQAVLKALTL